MHRSLLIVPLIGGALPLSLQAEVNVLPEIEVQGLAERAEDEVLTEKQLSRSSPTDMRDLFKESQSVRVGGGTGTSQKLFVRGVEDVNLNLQIDGARQGGYIFHHQGNLFLEPEFIKSVEVRPGTSMAQDGFGTGGGSVFIKTKNAFDFAAEGEDHGGLVKGTYYSNQRYLKPSLTLYSKPSESFAFLVSGVLQDGNEYANGDGRSVQGTADKLTSSLVKASSKTGNSSFDLGYERVVDFGLRAPRQNFGQADTDLLSRQESRRDTVSLSGNHVLNDLVMLEANLFASSSEIRRERENQSDSLGSAETWGGKFASIAELTGQKIQFGIDAFRAANIAAQGKEREENRGVFYQHHLSFSHTKIDAGLRVDSHEFLTAANKSYNSTALSPNLRGEVCATKGWCFFSGYSESFRGIRPAEALLITGTINYPDELKSEKALVREGGMALTHKNLNAKLVFFKNETQNFQILNRSNNTRENNGDLTTQGYEASLAFASSLLRARGSYTKISPSLNGKRLTNQTMGAATSLGDTWTLLVEKPWESLGINLGGSVRYVEKLEEGEVDKGAYQLFDLWVDWTPRNHKDFKLSLYAANLFNKLYVDHATYFTNATREPLWAPGRDLRLSASLRF